MNASGASGPSNEAAATPLHPDAPTAPTVEAPSGTAGLLEVSWTTPTGSTYEVRYWPADGRRPHVAVQADDGPEHPGLAPGGEHRAQGFGEGEGGSWSAPATARTGAEQSGRPLLSLHLLDGSGSPVTLSIHRESCSVGSLSGTAHPPTPQDPDIGSPRSACATIADDGEGPAYDYTGSNLDAKPT